MDYFVLMLNYLGFFQARLGEIPGHEDIRSGRNDQHSSNEAQQTGQTETAQSGQ